MYIVLYTHMNSRNLSCFHLFVDIVCSFTCKCSVYVYVYIYTCTCMLMKGLSGVILAKSKLCLCYMYMYVLCTGAHYDVQYMYKHMLLRFSVIVEVRS